jgi:hypothetical protein
VVFYSGSKPHKRESLEIQQPRKVTHIPPLSPSFDHPSPLLNFIFCLVGCYKSFAWKRRVILGSARYLLEFYGFVFPRKLELCVKRGFDFCPNDGWQVWLYGVEHLVFICVCKQNRSTILPGEAARSLSLLIITHLNFIIVAVFFFGILRLYACNNVCFVFQMLLGFGWNVCLH